VCDPLEIAERAMSKWKRHNPKPENTGWNPNTDLKAARQKHSAAVKAWTQRKDFAERECGYTAAHDAEGVACDEIARLTDALAGTPPAAGAR
jgi:hypothetical protein